MNFIKNIFLILDLFSSNRKSLSVQDMADLLSIPKSSVYRYVRILKDQGYLIEHYTGKYHLGYKFLEFANIVKSDINITEIAYGRMNDLKIEFDETVILSVLSDVYAVCLATSNSNRAIHVSSEEGKILPLHAGATSKAILAYQSDNFIENLFINGSLPRYTNHTLTKHEELVSNLNDIVAKGYAYSFSEVDENVISYGFPIQNTNRSVFASLSIAGPEKRMKQKDQKKLINKFQDVVKEIEYFL